MNAGYQAHTAEEDRSKGSQQDEPRAHAEVLEGAVLERAAQEAAQDRVPAPEHAAREAPEGPSASPESAEGPRHEHPRPGQRSERPRPSQAPGIEEQMPQIGFGMPAIIEMIGDDRIWKSWCFLSFS